MRTLSILIMSCAAIMFITGCAASNVEKNFGSAYRLEKEGQILNPDASTNLRPVEGMDAVAANIVMEKYRKEFEKPRPPQMFTFSLGSASSGGGY